MLQSSYITLIILTLLCLINSQPDAPSSIYGVRWSLGDRFSYSNRNNTENHNYYVLMFNSDEQLKKDVYVSVSNTIYTCTTRNLSVPAAGNSSETVVFINRCYINSNLWQHTRAYHQRSNDHQIRDYEVEYEIYQSSPDFKYKQEHNEIDQGNIQIVNRFIITSKTSLFHGSFRPVSMCCCQDLKFVSLGDWGEVGEDSDVIPILAGLLAAVEQDHHISIALFLGDLAYDFSGDKYYSMLRYMQPLTSKIAFMASPGNHDYVYYEDSFELFAESFISPQWDSYYNFYYTIVIGDLLLVQYVPQNLLYNEKYVVNVKPIDYMNRDLYHNQSLDPISQQYHVVVFTHYPIYCSEEDDSIKSCDLNEQRLTKYMQLFKGIGMDMYLSGHQHYYERMHEICFEEAVGTQLNIDHQVIIPSKVDGKDVYSDGRCPIYVIEGAAGNDMMMDQPGSITPRPYSANLSYGSGFGVLTYVKNQQLSYQHYKMQDPNSVQLTDHFIKKLITFPQNQTQDTPDPSISHPQSIKAFEIALIVIIIFTIALIVCVVRRCRKQPISQQQKQLKKDVEYIEENFNTIRSDKDEDNNNVMNSLRSNKDEDNIEANNLRDVNK